MEKKTIQIGKHLIPIDESLFNGANPFSSYLLVILQGSEWDNRPIPVIHPPVAAHWSGERFVRFFEDLAKYLHAIYSPGKEINNQYKFVQLNIYAPEELILVDYFFPDSVNSMIFKIMSFDNLVHIFNYYGNIPQKLNDLMERIDFNYLSIPKGNKNLKIHNGHIPSLEIPRDEIRNIARNFIQQKSPICIPFATVGIPQVRSWRDAKSLVIRLFGPVSDQLAGSDEMWKKFNLLTWRAIYAHAGAFTPYGATANFYLGIIPKCPLEYRVSYKKIQYRNSKPYRFLNDKLVNFLGAIGFNIEV